MCLDNVTLRKKSWPHFEHDQIDFGVDHLCVSER